MMFEKSSTRQQGPIVLRLRQDLEASAHGRHDVREVLHSPPEDEATADGVSRKGGDQDYHEVQDVQHTGFQGTDDDTEAGLRLERHEETDHEYQVVLRDEEP